MTDDLDRHHRFAGFTSLEHGRAIGRRFTGTTWARRPPATPKRRTELSKAGGGAEREHDHAKSEDPAAGWNPSVFFSLVPIHTRQYALCTSTVQTRVGEYVGRDAWLSARELVGPARRFAVRSARSRTDTELVKTKQGELILATNKVH